MNNKTHKAAQKITSCLLSLLLLLSLCPFTASAATAVSYLDYDTSGNVSTKTTTSYQPLTSDTTALNGWYYATGVGTISTRVTINGDARLILADNAAITINGGITVAQGARLTIYAQSVGSSAGKLIANAQNMGGSAGIGGYQAMGGASGDITIYGGNITATGGANAAGIGSGASGQMAGAVTVYGGNITATGGNMGAGIGAGTGGYISGNILIHGGVVTAQSNPAASAPGIGVVGGSASGQFAVTSNRAVVFATYAGVQPQTGAGILFVAGGYGTAPTSGSVYGTAAPSHSFTLPAGYTLTVADGRSLTIPQGVTLTNNGSIIIERGGTLVKNGTISGSGTITEKKCTESDHVYINGICKYCSAHQIPSVQSEGTYSGYYQIANAGNLLWFSNQVNSGATGANAILLNDINMSGITDFTPIGQTISFHEKASSDTGTGGYSGVFDGCGHAVKNLTLTGKSGGTYSYGIFGTLRGTVKNLGADSFTFTLGSASDCRVGAIVGQVVSSAVVSDCYAINSTLTATSKIAGSVAGCNYAGTIQNCYAYNCSVSAYTSRGGYVVGDCRGDEGTTDRPGTVKNCYAAACSYTSSNGSTTGVVGSQNVSSYITACEVLTADDFAGGAVAYKLGAAWGQNIDNGETVQTLPVLGGASVYQVKSGVCNDWSYTYSNTDADALIHNVENGICADCGQYDEPTLTTDKYDLNGDGTKESVYELANAGHLYWFAEQVNSGQNTINAILTDDITVNENLMTELITVNQEDYTAAVNNGKTVREWTPLGENWYTPYQGILDGGGHSVSGLYHVCDGTTWFSGGMIGRLTGTVQNLCVKNSYFRGIATDPNNDSMYVGALVGLAGDNSKIENCASDGNVIKSSYAAGGICGRMDVATLRNCYNDSTVVGDWKACGIVYMILGSSTGGATVEYNFSAGTVKSLETDSSKVYISGLYGDVSWSTIKSSYYLDTMATVACIDLNEGNRFAATAVDVTAKTADEIASGEVTWLLNGQKAGGAWGQKLEADESAAADVMPVLNSPNVVYKSLGGLCSAPQTQYANTESTNHVAHDEANVAYDNGFCPNCGAYEPATFKNNKYEISNAGQLYWFAEKVNSGEKKINAVLAQDITVNKNLMTELITVNQEDYTATVKKDKTVKSWTPIGGRYSSYKGTFDGNGYTIFGLYYNNSVADYIGLFGSMIDGTVRNLSIEGSYFCGHNYVGAIAGTGGSIEKCRSVGNVIKGLHRVGGICGQHTTGTISDCFNSSVVYCVGRDGYSSFAGGVVGEMTKAVSSSYVRPVVQNCFNAGSIIGGTYQNYHIGAIVGYAGSELERSNDFYLENNYYLSTDGLAAAGGATKPANVVNCEAKTAEELKMGEVARLLNGGKAEGAWGQTLGKDDLPTPGGAAVYCNGGNYSNTPVNGFVGIGSDQKSITFNVSEAGNYAITFAVYDEGETKKLSTLDRVSLTAAAPGEFTVSLSDDADFTLTQGVKVMLWGSADGIIPKCAALIVEE